MIETLRLESIQAFREKVLGFGVYTLKFSLDQMVYIMINGIGCHANRIKRRKGIR